MVQVIVLQPVEPEPVSVYKCENSGELDGPICKKPSVVKDNSDTRVQDQDEGRGGSPRDLFDRDENGSTDGEQAKDVIGRGLESFFFGWSELSSTDEPVLLQGKLLQTN